VVARVLPLRHEGAEFESAFLDTPAERRERLESLAEIYATALEELRERRDPTHAALIVRLETLRSGVLRELRYLCAAIDAHTRALAPRASRPG
jgi:hypothetical protein